jgi:Tfp pilus assembly protein PilF
MAGYSWGKSPGDRTRESTSRTLRQGIRPNRARPALNREQRRREDEREVRRYRQTRRAIEANAAELADSPESRLSHEALEAQNALAREQSQRDAETRAEERPYRRPLRDRTRIGPLEGIRQAQARLPRRDPRVDYLVTAGFITAAVVVGGLTRLEVYNHSGLPWLLAAGLAAGLVGLLVLDYRRWYGSFRIRFTRMGMVAGLTIFIGVTSIGRLWELAPVPLPSDCSVEHLRASLADVDRSPRDLVEYAEAVDYQTARLRRPGRLESHTERALAYVTRASFRLELDDAERALADINHSLRVDPSLMAGHVMRAGLFWRADCPQQAREDLAAIQRLAGMSDDGRWLLWASQWLFSYGHTQAALNVARRAAEFAPFSPVKAQIVQGLALARLGRLREAMGPLTASIEYDRRNEDAHFARGLVNRRLGDLEAALADFQRAEERGQQLSDERAAVGTTLFEQGHLSQGLAALNEAVQPEDPSLIARQWRGLALLQLGEANAARDDFKSMLEYAREGEDPGRPARAQLSEISQYIVETADPYVGLAAAELALGNREQAAQALADSRLRPVSWINEPIITAWRESLERELGARAAR